MKKGGRPKKVRGEFPVFFLVIFLRWSCTLRLRNVKIVLERRWPCIPRMRTRSPEKNSHSAFIWRAISSLFFRNKLYRNSTSHVISIRLCIFFRNIWHDGRATFLQNHNFCYNHHKRPLKVVVQGPLKASTGNVSYNVKYASAFIFPRGRRRTNRYGPRRPPSEWWVDRMTWQEK